MKCQYCGGNLGIENEVCPFCGRENIKAKKYINTRKDYQKEFAETERKVKKQVQINDRMGRVILIVLLLVILIVMISIGRQYADVAGRMNRREQRNEQRVEKNIDAISETLKTMERNRDYLLMSNYVLEYQLRSQEEFRDYTRVFTAVDSYEMIFESTLNIATGYDRRGENEITDWCKNVANAIANWNKYVEGEFWGDTADSPMHSGEHGEFLIDIKIAAKDIVQVYFSLTDEQAATMWTMKEEELWQLLCDQYVSLYPGGSVNE